MAAYAEAALEVDDPWTGFSEYVRLIRRVQDDGTLRSGFVSQDLVMVLMANAGLVRATPATTPDTWLGFVAYLLESVRAPGSGTLPAAPTPRQMYDALQRTAPPHSRS